MDVSLGHTMKRKASKRRSKSMHLPSGLGLKGGNLHAGPRAKGHSRIFEFEDAPPSCRLRARGAAVYDTKAGAEGKQMPHMGRHHQHRHHDDLHLLKGNRKPPERREVVGWKVGARRGEHPETGPKGERNAHNFPPNLHLGEHHHQHAPGASPSRECSNGQGNVTPAPSPAPDRWETARRSWEQTQALHGVAGPASPLLHPPPLHHPRALLTNRQERGASRAVSPNERMADDTVVTLSPACGMQTADSSAPRPSSPSSSSPVLTSASFPLSVSEPSSSISGEESLGSKEDTHPITTTTSSSTTLPTPSASPTLRSPRHNHQPPVSLLCPSSTSSSSSVCLQMNAHSPPRSKRPQENENETKKNENERKGENGKENLKEIENEVDREKRVATQGGAEEEAKGEGPEVEGMASWQNGGLPPGLVAPSHGSGSSGSLIRSFSLYADSSSSSSSSTSSSSSSSSAGTFSSSPPPSASSPPTENRRNSIIIRSPAERAALAAASKAAPRSPLSLSSSSLPSVSSSPTSVSSSPPAPSAMVTGSSALAHAERRQPAHRQLLLLNIYCPDRDVGIRLQFTPSSTVEEALEQTVRRLFAAAPPSPGLSSSPSSGAAASDPASLEETMKKPWKLLFLGDGSSSYFFLYRDRTLASYNLRDEDELDLVLPDGPPRLVKVTIRDNQSTFTQRVEEETTVWEVVHKITRKTSASAAYPLDEYGLFTSDGRCLKEEELISVHVLNIATKLEFRRMALPLKDIHQLHLKIVNTCEVPIAKSGDKQVPMEMTLGFNRNTKTKDALKRVLKLFPITDRFSAALYIPISRSWMPLDTTLEELHLEENTVIELRPLYKAYSLTIPFGKDHIREIYKFRPEDTVQSLYDLLLFNNPQVSEAKEKYTLCTRGGMELDPTRPIWAYDSSFEVRAKLQPVAVLIMGREEVIEVDFSAPVEKVIDSICRRFHLDETQKNRLTLHSPSSPGALNTRGSLAEQNVPPSCALIAKMAPPAADGGTTPSGATALAKAAVATMRGKAGGKSESDGAGAGADLTVGDVKISLGQLPSTLTIGKEDTGTYGENTNIWAEPDGPQYRSQETTPEGEVIIHYGTLNKLVVHLTAADNSDIRFMHAFLMTYLSFTNPRTLLNKLIERYHVPATTHSPAEVKRIQLKVCNVLKHWVSQHFDDFDHDLIQTVVSFVDDSLAVDGHDSITTVLRNAIVKRTCGLKSRVTRGRQLTALPTRGAVTPPPKLEVKAGKWRRSVKGGADLPADVAMSIFDYDEEEVARQLTICEFLLYREIKSSELLNQAWNKEKLHHKAFNVLQMIKKFNETSMWVVSLILEPIKVKHRAKRWEFLIKVAQHLLQLNNFNLVMSFVSGMNNSCVLRLKWTKGLLSKKGLETLERLEKLMSPDSSYKEYREALASVNPPCIPYIGVHLSDLVFMEDGNPDEVNGLINWDKRGLVYKVIDLLGRYQNSVYNLTYVGAIASFLEDRSAPSEKDLFDISLQREPRGAQKSQIF